MTTYTTRRERIAAEKRFVAQRRRKSLAMSVAGITTFASVTFMGLAPSQASMEDFAVGPNAGTATSATATYTVRSGDTLSKIAQAQGVSLNALLEANGLSVHDTIYPGQQLNLESGSVATTGQGGSANTTVSSGDPLDIERTSATTAASAVGTASAAGARSSTGGWQGTAINEALRIVNSGAGYVYGANGPSNYDCSAFTRAAFAAAGKSLPRVSSAQFAQAPQHVSLNNLQPGDLVFWSSNGSSSGIYHVALYVGDGKIAQARNPQAGISVDNLSTYQKYNPPMDTAARY